MKTFPLALAASILLGFLSGPLLAESCVTVAGQQIDPSLIYDKRHQCGTCAGQRAKPLLCGAINRMMVPYWSSAADIVGIPERGYWGSAAAKYAPEGTLKAAKEALNAGYRIMRFKVFFTGPDKTGQIQLLTGRHVSMKAYGGLADKYVWDYPPEVLTTFHMRKRDQSLSFEKDESLILFADLLKWAVDNQVLLIVDPVTNLAMVRILEQARSTGALAHIALRPDVGGYWKTKDALDGYLPNLYSSYEGQFLWQPPVNSSITKSWEDTRGLLKTWHTHTNESRQVLAYQGYLYSNTHWSTMPLTDENRSYGNLIEYIKELTPLGKRTSMWTVEALGDKGWLHTDYKWDFFTNSPADTRGNPWRNLSYKFATHLAIISDRPEWYENLTENPYP